MPIIAALLLLAGSLVGRLEIVNAPTDAIILVDGQETTGQLVGRRVVVSGLEPGTHEIRIRMAGYGDSAPHKVEIRPGDIAVLTLSPLSLLGRSKLGAEAGDVRVTLSKVPCTMRIGGKTIAAASAQTTAKNITAGAQTLDISCGGQQVRQSVDVRAGQVAIVEADIASGKVRVLRHEPRSRQITVEEPRPQVTAARDVPEEWTRAITETLDGGVREAKISRLGPTSVRVELRCRGQHSVTNAVGKLKRHRDVQDVTPVSLYDQRDETRATLNVFFMTR